MLLPKPPRGPRSPKTARPATGLPDRETLAAYIAEAGETELDAIARHYGLKGDARRALRFMLRDMEEAGVLGRRGRKGVAPHGALPPVGVVDVVERDTDGDLFVKLAKSSNDVPLVRLAPGKHEARAPAPGIGDRLLVRFEKREDGETEAKVIKTLGGANSQRVLGVIRKSRREVRIEPVDRRSKESLIVPDGADLKDGDLVLAMVSGGGDRGYGPKRGKVLEVVGREDQPRAASLIALHTHNIPTGFPEAAEREAEAAKKPTLGTRTDLRGVPLVTIDPPDARDHDDAVFAEPDPNHPGGWIVWVAIADVAAYVRQGTALDKTAWEKGNSVYFPDRVEPMLPERLSAGLCSLRAGEDRACMAVRMVFNADGKKTGHKFVRGLMRSAAKLSYEQAQAAIDGQTDDTTGPLLEPILFPLWAAYATMKKGRDARQPLAIETMERRIQLTREGEVASIEPRASLEAHKLIEEMMIQANVCAAETLEARKVPLIYRVHDEPSQEKLFNLADFLSTIAMPWTKGEPVRTDRFNRLLAQTREGPHADIVNEVVLRTQMQAIYSPDNTGHFGLNLQRYAHFTSPIRRYADLVVHRALIRAEKLGDDGLTDQEIVRLTETAEHITATERRAMAAERDATDRYVAAFLADRVGAEFAGRITGVTRFGLFIRLNETGADGLVPVSSLGSEYFIHDDRTHSLVGERTGERWPLGMMVRVRLTEATPLTGGLLFEMLSEPAAADPNAPRPRLGLRPRGGPGGPFRGPPRGGPQRGGLPKGVKRGSNKRRS
jgi:ribonuclease R